MSQVGQVEKCCQFALNAAKDTAQQFVRCEVCGAEFTRLNKNEKWTEHPIQVESIIHDNGTFDYPCIT